MWITVRSHFHGPAGVPYDIGRHEISAEDADALAQWAIGMEAERNRRELPAPPGYSFVSGDWPPFRFEPEGAAAPIWEPSS